MGKVRDRDEWRGLSVKYHWGGLGKEETIFGFSLLCVRINVILGLYMKKFQTWIWLRTDEPDCGLISWKTKGVSAKPVVPPVAAQRSHQCSKFCGESKLKWV